jgi:mannose-6-phosphate isomerase-like protein (cupin superfamily)
MASFSHINLLDLENTAKGGADGIEGRFGRRHLDSRDLGVSLWHYAPGFRADIGHRHREQEEAYVVVAGSGRILLDDEIRELRPWDVVRVAPEVVRAFAAGPEGLEIVAVGGPKPEGGDGEQTDVSWPGQD